MLKIKIVFLMFLTFIFSLTTISSITYGSNVEQYVLDWMFDNGLTKFNNEKEFNSNGKITREQASKFLTNFAIFLLKDNKKIEECNFNDINEADKSLQPYIFESCRLGIFKGYNGSFFPFENLTNAQAITIAVRTADGMLEETEPYYQVYLDKANEKGYLIGNEHILNKLNSPAIRGDVGRLLYIINDIKENEKYESEDLFTEINNTFELDSNNDNNNYDSVMSNLNDVLTKDKFLNETSENNQINNTNTNTNTNNQQDNNVFENTNALNNTNESTTNNQFNNQQEITNPLNENNSNQEIIIDILPENGIIPINVSVVQQENNIIKEPMLTPSNSITFNENNLIIEDSNLKEAEEVMGGQYQLPSTGMFSGMKDVIREMLKKMRTPKRVLLNNVVKGFGDIDNIIVGDWNGDGKDTIAYIKGSRVYGMNGPLKEYTYGDLGDKMIAGDWNGDGKDTIGIVRGSTFYLDNDWDGGGEISFIYGDIGDSVIVGDWNSDGKDDIGVYGNGKGNAIYWDLEHTTNGPNYGEDSYFYGNGTIGDKFFIGSWGISQKEDVGLKMGGDNKIYIGMTRSGMGDVTMENMDYNNIFIGDFDGDGIDDFGYITNDIKIGKDYIYPFIGVTAEVGYFGTHKQSLINGMNGWSVDFKMPGGSSIVASRGGVVKLKCITPKKKQVAIYIDHKDGTFTNYYHLATNNLRGYSNGVFTSYEINQGEKLGEIYGTPANDYSDNCQLYGDVSHLHFGWSANMLGGINLEGTIFDDKDMKEYNLYDNNGKLLYKNYVNYKKRGTKITK